MTSESDESIQIYNVKDGKHQKSCLSKKYGVKHANFTHTSSCIVYASTKENGMFFKSVFPQHQLLTTAPQIPLDISRLMTILLLGTSPVMSAR
jgi:hypothetical protein